MTSFNSLTSNQMFGNEQNPASGVEQRDRIFAVDDSVDNLFLLEAILGEYKQYELTTFTSGADALEEIEKSPPTLLLLDVMMPGMDGYEVTQRIRSNPALPYIPILLITAHDSSSVVKGLDMGADDFLRKPLSVDELSARVRSLLRLKHSMDAQSKLITQREDLVARLTHDLRTPLVAANRVLEMAVAQKFGDAPDALRTMLSNVITNNDQLLAMTNTLLEVYRHDAGCKEMAFIKVELAPLIESVVEQLVPLAEKSGLALTFEPDEALSKAAIHVNGDSMELRRVLTNLIGNSIKFTDAGSITVRCGLVQETNGQSMVKIEIEDTGRGISPQEQQTVFDRYRQGDHMRAGSGLGLHLVECIVTAHGGQVSVESEVGKGSNFKVLLPQLAIAPQKALEQSSVLQTAV